MCQSANKYSPNVASRNELGVSTFTISNRSKYPAFLDPPWKSTPANIAKLCLIISDKMAQEY